MKKNREIEFKEVRVINSVGAQMGVLPFEVALRLAKNEGLDLVLITEKPPVAKIADYSKMLFEAKKREKEDKKKQRENAKSKEIQLHPTIAEGDIEVKIRQIKQFLQEGVRTKIFMSFRGREASHFEVGEAVMNKFKKALEVDGVLDGMHSDSKTISMTFRGARK